MGMSPRNLKYMQVPQPVAQIPATAEIEAVLRDPPMPASPTGEGEETQVEAASE
jgi:hypothetical protein